MRPSFPHCTSKGKKFIFKSRSWLTVDQSFEFVEYNAAKLYTLVASQGSRRQFLSVAYSEHSILEGAVVSNSHLYRDIDVWRLMYPLTDSTQWATNSINHYLKRKNTMTVFIRWVTEKLGSPLLNTTIRYTSPTMEPIFSRLPCSRVILHLHQTTLPLLNNLKENLSSELDVKLF